MKLAARVLLVVIVALGVTVPLAQSANAAPARTASTSAQNSAVKWLGDNLALTQINLSPGTQRFVNRLIKAVGPIMCPLLGKAAAPEFASVVVEGCKAMVASADPWSQLKTLIPLFCQLGDMIFPNYAKLLALACPLLV